MGAFSIFGNKKKEKAVDGKSYYKRLGVYAMLAKYLCLLLALVVVLYGFSFRTDEINADNFRYLLSFLGTGETDTQTYNTIYFDNNETNRFALVRGDLAVVNNSGSAVYSLAGVRRSVDTGIKMDAPEVLSSAKYMYIYDLGGTDVVVKSTLETMQTIECGYPIRAAAATDNGYFAVVSEKKTSRSTVFVYDDSFRMVYDCSYGSLYTISADLNDSATRLVTASVDVENGEFVTTLYLYSLSTEDPIAKHVVTGEYPYRVAFGDGDAIVLLTDTACRFYDKDGVAVATVPFGNDGIIGYYIGGKYFLRQYPISALSSAVRLEVYSITDGTMVHWWDYGAGLRFAETHGHYLFTVSGEDFYVKQLQSGEERHVPDMGAAIDVLPLEEGKTLVLTDGTADMLNHGALFEKKGEESSWE